MKDGGEKIIMERDGRLNIIRSVEETSLGVEGREDFVYKMIKGIQMMKIVNECVYFLFRVSEHQMIVNLRNILVIWVNTYYNSNLVVMMILIQLIWHLMEKEQKIEKIGFKIIGMVNILIIQKHHLHTKILLIKN